MGVEAVVLVLVEVEVAEGKGWLMKGERIGDDDNDTL